MLVVLCGFNSAFVQCNVFFVHVYNIYFMNSS